MDPTQATDADIRALTRRLLRKADALDVFPTPVEQIIEAAGLTEASEDLFHESLLEKVPALLRRKIKRLKHRVLAAIDRREKHIYIDTSKANAGALAFRRLHEVSHDILPWQRDVMFADDKHTLSLGARRQFEREANFGAGELLFQNENFELTAADYDVAIASVIELADVFGASIHAALRRYAASHALPLAAIVLEAQPTVDVGGTFQRNEIIQSHSWQKQFSFLERVPTNMRISRYPFLKEALSAQMCPNTLISGMRRRINRNGSTIDVRVEALYTRYKILVLLSVPVKRRFTRAKRIISR